MLSWAQSDLVLDLTESSNLLKLVLYRTGLGAEMTPVWGSTVSPAIENDKLGNNFYSEM